MAIMRDEKTCLICGKLITSASRIKFCSDQCRTQNHRQKYRYEGDDVKLTHGKAGAVSELVVSANLLSKGFEVFRSVSQDCSCDLIAYINGKMFRVEVRTGGVRIDGIKAVPFQPRDANRSDVFAVVYRRSEVAYFDTATRFELGENWWSD